MCLWNQVERDVQSGIRDCEQRMRQISSEKVSRPYHACRLHVAVTPLIRPIRGIQDAAESDASENAAVRLLDVRHQLPHVAVEADVLLRLQLLYTTGETRDQDLEDTAHDLSLNPARPVTTGVVRRRYTAHGSAGTARARGAGAEICRIRTPGRYIGRLARYSFLVWKKKKRKM